MKQAGLNVGVIGATGYVGGRLVPALLDAGHRVRCLARAPGRLDGVAWRAEVEVVDADVLDQASLRFSSGPGSIPAASPGGPTGGCCWCPTR